MQRLIDAEQFEREMRKICGMVGMDMKDIRFSAQDMIYNVKMTDEGVVRCAKCRFYDAEDDWCMELGTVMRRNEFCSRGQEVQ